MTKIKYLSILAALSLTIQAQQITLGECFKMAVENHVLNKEKENIESIHDFKYQNLSAKWLPEMSIQAQATYQDPVLNIEMPVPGNGVFGINQPHDQYKAWIDIKQNIYDGGIIKQNKNIEEKNEMSDIINNDIKVNDIKKTVSDIYFNILAAKAQQRQLQLLKNEINERLTNINILVTNGAALKSNYEALTAEKLKLEQQLYELNFNVSNMVYILGTFTEMTLNDSIELSVPDLVFQSDTTITRLEYNLFDAQKEKLTAYKGLYQSALYPKIYGFAQIGYGKPGLNMLSEDFSDYYIIGAGLNWTIFDWNQARRQKQIIEVQKNSIETTRKNYDKNLDVAIEKAVTNIKTYEYLIKSDADIIDAYGKVAQTARSQFENGSINSVDLITELNKEKAAQINNEIHKIKYTQAIAEYYLLTGKF